MRKLQKLTRGLWKLITKPYLINKVLEDDDPWWQKLDTKYGKRSLPLLRIDQLIHPFPQDISGYSFLDGGSSPLDLLLLKYLAGQFTECRYFEIGTWRGESVRQVAEVAQECVTVNLPADTMRQMGMDDKYILQHDSLSQSLTNVKHIKSDTRRLDFALLGKFNLVFIDGDHHYEMVRQDTEKVFQHLLHKNSIVVWHDYAYEPSNIRPEVLNGILDGVPENQQDKLYAVSHTKCCLYHPAISISPVSQTFYDQPRVLWKMSLSPHPMDEPGDPR